MYVEAMAWKGIFLWNDKVYHNSCIFRHPLFNMCSAHSSSSMKVNALVCSLFHCCFFAADWTQGTYEILLCALQIIQPPFSSCSEAAYFLAALRKKYGIIYTLSMCVVLLGSSHRTWFLFSINRCILIRSIQLGLYVAVCEFKVFSNARLVSFNWHRRVCASNSKKSTLPLCLFHMQ